MYLIGPHAWLARRPRPHTLRVRVGEPFVILGPIPNPTDEVLPSTLTVTLVDDVVNNALVEAGLREYWWWPGVFTVGELFRIVCDVAF